MSGEYKSSCGCRIHVIQWTSKHKVVTQESCPLHKHAKELLDALRKCRYRLGQLAGPKDDDANRAVLTADTTIAKAEGRQ